MIRMIIYIRMDTYVVREEKTFYSPFQPTVPKGDTFLS